MNKLQVFRNDRFGSFRVVKIEERNEIWISGEDIAKIVGFDNPIRDANKNVKDKDKLMLFFDKDGHSCWQTFIDEEGFYDLISSSEFQDIEELKDYVLSCIK